jgi:hypothetical protein
MIVTYNSSGSRCGATERLAERRGPPPAVSESAGLLQRHVNGGQGSQRNDTNLRGRGIRVGDPTSIGVLGLPSRRERDVSFVVFGTASDAGGDQVSSGGIPATAGPFARVGLGKPEEPAADSLLVRVSKSSALRRAPSHLDCPALPLQWMRQVKQMKDEDRTSAFRVLEHSP